MGRHAKYEIVSSGHWDLGSIIGIVLAFVALCGVWVSDIQAKSSQLAEKTVSLQPIKKAEPEKKVEVKTETKKEIKKQKEFQVAIAELAPLQTREITTTEQMNHSYRVVTLISEPIPGRAEEQKIVKEKKGGKKKEKILIRDLE